MQRRIIVSEFDSRESRDDANQEKMFLNRLQKSKKEYKQGNVQSAREVFERLRKKYEY